MRNFAIILSVIGIGVVAASAQAADHGKGHGQWDQLDANGDGKITADEMNAKHADFFAKADGDGDGAITREEMEAFHIARRAEHMQKRSGDSNGDGVVDRSEYIEAAGERFDRLDKDGDGVLSKDEMRAHHGQGHHGKGHHRRGHEKK